MDLNRKSFIHLILFFDSLFRKFWRNSRKILWTITKGKGAGINSSKQDFISSAIRDRTLYNIPHISEPYFR
jgi:hypothetical protein